MVIYIPEICKEIPPHSFLKPLDIKTPELIPLSQDNHRICIPDSIVGTVQIFHRFRKQLPCLFNTLGIAGPDMGTCFDKLGDNDQGRGFPHIISLRLEGESQHCYGFLGQIPT